MAVMPMFPLGSVLLPGAILPLHVFEPRYRQLVTDCLQAEVPEFGVVMIERGSEVGGGDQRARIGSVARMLQVAELGDGRFALLCVGSRRIRVNAWLPDDPYPLADVDDWPDEIPADWGGTGDREITALLDSLSVRVRRAAALAVELGDSTIDVAGANDASAGSDEVGDIVAASYRIAMLAPIGPSDLFVVLSASGPVERLARLDEVMVDVEAMLQFRLSAGDGPMC